MEFIKDKQIQCFINPNVKPVIQQLENNTTQNYFVYYTWNNFLYKLNTKSNEITLKIKLTSNPITKLIQSNKNMLYVLSSNSNLQSAELIEFDTMSDEIKQSYNFESKPISNFEYSPYDDTLYFLSKQSLLKFCIKKFIITQEISISDLSVVDFVKQTKSFSIINISESSSILLINIQDSIVLFNLASSKLFIIKNAFIKNIKSVVCKLSDDYVNLSSDTKLIISDYIGKIHIVSNFLQYDSIDKQLKFYEDYIVSTYHWHSQECVIDINRNNIFTGSVEGVVTSWNINNLNKTFFPRICTDINQISCNDSIVVITTKDQLLVYSYLENKMISVTNFLDSNIDDLEIISCNNYDIENTDDKSLCFVNKSTFIVYLLNKKKVKRIELNNTNNRSNLSSSSKSSTFPSLKSAYELCHIRISSNNLNNNRGMFIFTIEKITLENNHINLLKVYSISSMDKSSPKVSLISLAQNPHGISDIKKIDIYALPMNNFILITYGLDSISNKHTIKIWKNKLNLGFICDFSYVFDINKSSLIFNLNYDYESNLPYLIVHHSNQLLKINLDSNEIENRLYVNTEIDEGANILFDTNERIYLISKSRILCINNKTFDFIFTENFDNVNIIDSKISNDELSLLIKEEDVYYNFDLNKLDNYAIISADCFKIKNIKKIGYIRHESGLYVFKKNHSFNQVISLLDIKSSKSELFKTNTYEKKDYNEETKQNSNKISSTIKNIIQNMSNKANEEDDEHHEPSSNKNIRSILDNKLSKLLLKK